MKEHRIDDYCKFLSTQTIYCEQIKKDHPNYEYCNIVYDLYSECVIYKQRIIGLPKYHK